MRRIILLLTAAAVMVLTLAVGAASAHDHQICTPGQGNPTLAQEPFHTQDPSMAKVEQKKGFCALRV